MKITTSIDQPLELTHPVILTIGNYDGVHLGHSTVLSAVKKQSTVNQLPSCVITFRNHPSQVLRPNHPALLITSCEHKLSLLEQFGIDTVILLDFTPLFSEQSAQNFLERVYKNIPFRHLILGHDAKLGNDRQGNTPFMHELAGKFHAQLTYLPPVVIGNQPISSTRIRTALQNLDLKEVKKCLGRPYSIFGKVIHGKQLGHQLGYPTANLSLEGLCHPPYGVYIVSAVTPQGTFPAVANLGIAPTVRQDHVPLLEVHLLEAQQDLYDQEIEVIFHEFLRPERVFSSVEELKAQISQDAAAAKLHFKL